MKNKITFLVIIILVLAISFFANIYKNEDIIRYHQHLENSKDDTYTYYYAGKEFKTHLPIISINTHGLNIPGNAILDKEGFVTEYTTTDDGQSVIPADITIIDNTRQDGILHNSAINKTALIRIRGNSSRLFDKKSYKIDFVNDVGEKEDVEVMGMSAYNEWALNGPFLDKTLMRNYLCLNISAEILGYAPNVRYCEVFINDEYKGLYVMMETISVGKNRVNITEYKEGKRAYGYLLKVDKQSQELTLEALNQFSNYTNITEYKKNISIEYPGSSKLTPKIKQEIEYELSEFEKALFSYDYDSKELGYRAYIDVDSFVDYYILMEFWCINDMCSMSTYLYKDVNTKYILCPVWDFNNAMDNFIAKTFENDDIYFTSRLWYKMLLKDKWFVDRVVKRYHELRESYLSEEYILNYIDETQSYLGDAVDRNFDVWGYSFDPSKVTSVQRLRPLERNPKSYEEAIEQIKQFTIRRGRWMDEHIETLYQYCHESKTKLYK